MTITNKRQKTSQTQNQNQPLLPGLPDHIAQISLSLLPPSLLCSVCHSWRSLIHSPYFPPYLSIYTLLLPTPPNPSFQSDPLKISSFDPILNTWTPLPHAPPLHLLTRHPSFLSRRLPVQTVGVRGKLVLVAATTHPLVPALDCPLVFDPVGGTWSHAPKLSEPRRWCVAGACGGALVVASGIGSHYTTGVAKTVEKWDPLSNFTTKNGRGSSRFEVMRPLKNGKFSREPIDAIGWRNKMYMVNVQGDFAKEGAVYDVVLDQWSDMPQGMLAGWKGAATSMDEETIYCVDESKGVLKKYNGEKDWWEDVFVCEKFIGAENISAGGGRVCVVCGGGVEIVVVDVVAPPPRGFWVVDTPPGFQAVGIHILPRMSRME